VIGTIYGQRTSSKETLKEITRMRILIVNLLATALLLFGASTASAFALSATLNPGMSPATAATPLAVSDFVIVDVYLDADPGLGFLSVAVVYDDNDTLRYERGLSTTASYVLYAPGAGASSATYLIPNANPPLYWGGLNQPGKRQVNVDFLEQALGSATGTGNGIWLATLVFHAVGNGNNYMELSLLANGTIVEAYTNDVKGLTSVSGGFPPYVPEPTTALLIGFGLVGLTVAGRRKD
jgi:hypothetical protein